MNPPVIPAIPQPTWGKIDIAQIIAHRPGFVPAKGYHIYCELRPTQQFELAEDENRYSEFLRTIDDYGQMGAEAAKSYGLILLEFQGRVLHFFKAGENTSSNTDAVLDFVHEFTQSAYEELRRDMEEDWNGFASAFDHGRCILINHISRHAQSTVSLGPSANEPAKRCFSATPAGFVSAPSRLISHLNPSRGEWTDLNVRDRKTSPSQARNEMARQFSQIRSRIQKSDSHLVNFSAKHGENILFMTPDKPLRMIGSAVRCDLDGFTALVEDAFDKGDAQIAKVAQGFKMVMEYAEFVAGTNQPCTMLAWAGDCVTFLLPDLPNIQSKTPRWLTFSMDWLASEVNGMKSPLASNLDLSGINWGIGAAHGESGKMVVAATLVQGRQFVISGGWPPATAKLAQETAKGGQVAIHSDDHTALDKASRSLFEGKNQGNFWYANNPSNLKLKKAAIEVGAAMSAPQIITSKSTVARPANRPYSPGDA